MSWEIFSGFRSRILDVSVSLKVRTCTFGCPSLSPYNLKKVWETKRDISKEKREILKKKKRVKKIYIDRDLDLSQ